MNKREALRILNLIGVTSRNETEFRYLQLRARVEILLGEADSPELQQMYRDTAHSLEEAYHLLTRNKDAKLLTEGSATTANWTETEVDAEDTTKLVGLMRASLLELSQIRTSLQQYSALLEIKLERAETVIKRVETLHGMLDDMSTAVDGLRTSAEHNAAEIATYLEQAKQLACEIQIRRTELAEHAPTAKTGFLTALARTRH
ncbi:MAG: hypothetical protein HY961_17855 [Ignavibacteriae bacterium]|nr:hypothetical protein [Ignavibacteriota bacterium]